MSECWYRQNLIVLLINILCKYLASKISFSNRGCAKFFVNTKGPGASCYVAVCAEYFENIFSFVIWHKLVKFYKQTAYFPCFLVTCISCFMLRHLISWNLNFWNSKIWFSWERKECLKWKKKTFFLVSQVLSFRLEKDTSKNIAQTTFIDWTLFAYKNLFGLT